MLGFISFSPTYRLAYYQSVREAARRNVQGAKGIYEDLRQRFPGASHTAVPKEPAVTA
jgi:hypothetical protein